MTAGDGAWSRSDGVIAIRPPAPGEEVALVAGRDAEWERWLGPGDETPRPTAVIVVNGEIVGWVDFDTDRDWLAPGEVNLGYNVYAPYRRRGYASRAVELLVQHLTDEGDQRSVRLSIDRGNAASLGVARRGGFTPVGPADAESLDFIRTIPRLRATTAAAPTAGPVFVVICGPIAAGKSTVAEALATRRRSHVRTVAIVDPDDIVAMLGGFRGLTPARWKDARIIHALTVAAWLEQGIDVIAPGPFFDDEENTTLLRHVPSTITPRRALVEVPYDVAATRVTADAATREVSSELGLLRHAYQRYERLRDALPEQEWRWDTTHVHVDYIADVLAAALGRDRLGGR